MAENTERPLTDQTLARLHKLAEGNGLEPKDIELIETVEKTYAIEGVLQLVPFCENHPGRGKEKTEGRIMLPDMAALQEAVKSYQQGFLNSREWVPDALKEMGDAPGGGWGLDGSKVTLPSRSKTFAATQVCPTCQGAKAFTCTQCRGQGFIVCTYCEGRGEELCYNCAGRGVNPAHPDKSCVICHGKRYSPCRFCNLTGKLVCSSCQGRRQIVCSRCGGIGSFTQEITLSCGATITFSIKGNPEWPSGLRRGIERVGLVNLPKGHADVRKVTTQEANERAEEETEKDKEKAKSTNQNVIRYEATLPYADLKIRFGGSRAVLVSAFGKRGALMGVPAFLDETLQPWREKLKQAMRNASLFDEVIKVRAMRDALALDIGGKGKVENMRKIYPFGLSRQTTQEILQNMRRALNRFTMKIRIGAATGGGLLGAILLAGFILTPLHTQLVKTQPAGTSFMIDLLALMLVMGAAWVGLGKLVQFMLQRQFPGLKISLHSNAGHIGYGMLAALAVIWLGLLVSIPEKSPWILQFFGS